MTLTPSLTLKLYQALGLDPQRIREVTLKLVPGKPIGITVERSAEDYEVERMLDVLQKEALT